MTHRIDARFRQRKQELAARRRQALWGKILAFTVLLLAAAAGIFVYIRLHDGTAVDEDEDLVPTEASGDLPPDALVYVPAIVDLAGDPVWINLSRDSTAPTKLRALPKPADLIQPGISPQIRVLADTMLSPGERFMTTIPSTQEDFAFYQAQRASAPASDLPGDPALAAPGAGEAVDRSQVGAGASADAPAENSPASGRAVVENNTSVATVTPEAERFEATEDTFVKVLADRSLDSVLLDAHFAPEEAKAAGEALKALFQLDALQAGLVVAMRGYRSRREATPALMQVSVYAKDRFIGTLARNAAGVFAVGADPWLGNDLFNYSGMHEEDQAKRQYRLLDAIYSTAARNDVPSGVIGEAITYLSRGQDLNTFAGAADQLLLLYSDTPRDMNGTAGRVLYVGVHGGEKTLDCYVFAQGDGQFSCVTGDDQVRSLSVTNGMVIPVDGVMISTFGPGKDPATGAVRVNKGIDWAAPLGTPVVAAFDGEVVFQGDGGSEGNLLRLSHANNRETRYASLSRFALQGGVGTKVKAGDIVGYVGSTGASAAPHLHFELYQNGEATNPLGTVTAVASDDSAVETLTNRIIHVESGGNPTVKNPRSSATGLGQFISTTWIRMIQTYRPELARSLSTQDVLALRNDPTISREMVRNLAREGEAYLRARGHAITAGRLYLCHFLGMDGANQVLRAAGDASLVSVLGAGVIQANPFLTGKNASYVIAWAEAKMRGRAPSADTDSSATTTIAVKQTSPEFEGFKKAIGALLQASG